MHAAPRRAEGKEGARYVLSSNACDPRAMLFNSGSFAVFFPVVTLLYFVTPARFRWALLLAASAIFYMAFVPYYILILLFAIVVDYGAGIFIDRAEGARRRLWLVVSIIANVSLLAFFKYWNFITDNLHVLAGLLGSTWSPQTLRIVLPIGLSFHVFQSLSYTIEVYRRRQTPERHFGIYALYVMFYPQLVAGPIERPQNLLWQFRAGHDFDARRCVRGLERMVWGLFKKLVIADRLAAVVGRVYGHPREFTGLALVFATLSFSVQIYCDFSGYSDIALGAAEVMGFRLMENFKQPYGASSIAEFWTRWHISLSTWFRDYLYIPLGGNRVGRAKWLRNAMVVFLLSGLWHGASWTYVLWGAIHGVLLCTSVLTERLRSQLSRQLGLSAHPGLRRALSVTTVFLLVSYAWIFFRATTIGDAIYIASHAFVGWGRQLASLRALTDTLASVIPARDLVVAAGAVAVLFGVDTFSAGGRIGDGLERWPVWKRWSLYYVGIFAVVLLGVYERKTFIYFQF
jgi:alginate O-acetyltransferase complex protein AlgI